MTASRTATALASLVASTAIVVTAGPSYAIDVPIGDETLTIDVNNTVDLGYRVDNRNDTAVDPKAPVLTPSQLVDDHYAEWFNRLYVRAFYWKLSLGVRLDSALYFDTLSRDGIQELVRERTGSDSIGLENRFNEELHSRFGSHLPGGVRGLVYPSKLWLGFKHEGFEATVGDFYEQLGRGLVFSVRKIDEVGIDTTVRGLKLGVRKTVDDWRIEATAFGGQLNPIRIDYPTGRILHGSGSPLFFGFPEAAPIELWVPNHAYVPGGDDPEFLRIQKRAKPSYLEDTVVGGNVTFGPRAVQIGLNTAVLFRQSNSEELERCKLAPGADVDLCEAEFPAFGQVEASRLHDQIRNFGVSLRVPPIADTIDGYVEVVGQNQVQGHVAGFDPRGNPIREKDLWGHAVYANVNVTAHDLTATVEAKHYRSFFALGANIDGGAPPYGAPEFAVVAYSRPPTAESIYTQPIGSPDICVTGGRARLDYALDQERKIYGWVGRYSSWSEIDATNAECVTDADRRTDTWDTAAGMELDVAGGRSHYWGWIGARLSDRAVAAVQSPDIPVPSTVFYREGYVRYDFNQHVGGPISLAAFGNHRYRYQPEQQPHPWNEGENLLALNWNPHLAFIFGYEYQTRPGFPTHYFNGSIQWRAKSQEWWGKLFDSARLFVGQRRAALRCVGGVCRVFPAFEGARFELVSEF